MTSRNRKNSVHARRHTGFRRGWGALGVATLVAGVGLMVTAQTSHAADGDTATGTEGTVTGQTMSGATAAQGWVDMAAPSFMFSTGSVAASAMELQAPGFLPTRYKGQSLTAIGYCIEPGVSGTAPSYELLFPQDYLAGAAQRRNVVGSKTAENMRKITWVAQNSFPAVDVASVNKAAGISGATDADVFNATQAAIWNFANGMTLRSGNAKVMAVYDYLVNNAKEVALPQAQLSLNPAVSTTSLTGGSTRVGPIEVKAYHTITSLTVKAESSVKDVQLVDGNGKPLTGNITNGTQVYANVPAGVDSGTISLTFSGQGHATLNGMVGVGKAHSRDRMAQSQLVMGTPKPATITTTGKLTWTTTSSRPHVQAPQPPKQEPAPAPSEPSIKTVATGVGGEKVITIDGGRTTGTVLDKVIYTGLTGGSSYKVSGELMDKATKQSTGITGSKTFTAAASGSGTVTVQFAVPMKWAGKDLVAFETVSQLVDGKRVVVAEHKDIDDAAQTVGIATPAKPAPAPAPHPLDPAPKPQSPSLPHTGVSDQTRSLAMLGLGLALGGGVITMLAARRPTRRTLA